MIKKIVILLGILFIILFATFNYVQKKNETVECWWGVMYPALSFIALEDEDEPVRYSSLDNHFIKQEKEPEIKYDFMFFKWLKRFSF